MKLLLAQGIKANSITIAVYLSMSILILIHHDCFVCLDHLLPPTHPCFSSLPSRPASLSNLKDSLTSLLECIFISTLPSLFPLMQLSICSMATSLPNHPTPLYGEDGDEPGYWANLPYKRPWRRGRWTFEQSGTNLNLLNQLPLIREPALRISWDTAPASGQAFYDQLGHGAATSRPC